MLVDTSIWSLALRREEQPVTDRRVTELTDLIEQQRVVMIGPIRQELLSGLRHQEQFERLREHLRAFPDLPLAHGDFEEAAAMFNLCRSRGVQGSNTDFLICAVAARHELAIMTADADFSAYARHLPINLVEGPLRGR